VGSGNLSSNGIDLGREVFTAFSSGTSTGDAAIAIWRDWMRQIVYRIGDTLLAGRFADLESRLPSTPPLAPVVDPPLLNNLEHPLLAQFVERVGAARSTSSSSPAPFTTRRPTLWVGWPPSCSPASSGSTSPPLPALTVPPRPSGSPRPTPGWRRSPMTVYSLLFR